MDRFAGGKGKKRTVSFVLKAAVCHHICIKAAELLYLLAQQAAAVSEWREKGQKTGGGTQYWQDPNGLRQKRRASGVYLIKPQHDSLCVGPDMESHSVKDEQHKSIS